MQKNKTRHTMNTHMIIPIDGHDVRPLPDGHDKQWQMFKGILYW